MLVRSIQATIGSALVAFLLLNQNVFAAPQRNYNQDPNREFRTIIDDLRLSSNNHETELRENEEKFKTYEAMIDALRKQINEASKNHKEQLKSSNTSIDIKLGDLEMISKGLVTDLKILKNNANETAAAIAQYKISLQEIEKVIELQNQNIQNLQLALKALMDVMQAKDVADSSSKTYRVKSGDSLEKIAQTHQTTIKALKELNGLANDRINIDQKLKLPDK